MSDNLEVKGSLAKCLATENLIIEHKKIPTAYFDVTSITDSATGDYIVNFVKLARSVYITNDKRAELKRQINEETGSHYREIKVY